MLFFCKKMLHLSPFTNRSTSTNCSESDSNDIVCYRYSCSVAFSILIELEQLLKLGVNGPQV